MAVSKVTALPIAPNPTLKPVSSQPLAVPERPVGANRNISRWQRETAALLSYLMSLSQHTDSTGAVAYVICTQAGDAA